MSSPVDQIRPGHEGDLEALTRIYNHYIERTSTTFDVQPFTTEQRRPWLTAHPDQGPYRLLVAEDEGRVLGYATSSPFRPKAAYSTSVETTVYLAPEHTGRGLGSRLYTALLETLRTENVHLAVAGVAMPNEASQRLHLRCGFRLVGVFEEVGHKFGRFWDVAWFQQRLTD